MIHFMIPLFHSLHSFHDSIIPFISLFLATFHAKNNDYSITTGAGGASLAFGATTAFGFSGGAAY
jgi:hypothetical protein